MMREKNVRQPLFVEALEDRTVPTCTIWADGGTLFIQGDGMNDQAIVMQDDAADKPIPKMKNVSLETVLRRILARVPYPGTTYIIRRDAIEITTLKAVALEKTVRAYPVADLVVPIPNSINQQSVQQAARFLQITQQQERLGQVDQCRVNPVSFLELGHQPTCNVRASAAHAARPEEYRDRGPRFLKHCSGLVGTGSGSRRGSAED